ncbi:MAG: periplasmic heavy metal sensor, partial [Deltaproteobacteria bacterium]
MSEIPETVVAPVQRTRGLKIALVVSLAVNVLIIGLIIGAMSHRWKEPDMRQDRVLADAGFSPYVAALEPEDRRDLAREIMKRASDFKRNRQEIQAEFAAVLAILRAPEFNAAAFRASLSAQGTKLEERRASGVDIFVEQLSGMD